MVNATVTTYNNNNNNITDNNYIRNDDFVDVVDTTLSHYYIDILSDDDHITSTFLPQPPPISTTTPTSTTTADRSSIRLLYGTIFNFINCIVGAGAIGLGSAIANTGGIISILIIISVATLVKLSLDLIIDLSINTNCNINSTINNVPAPLSLLSYEDLGYIAYGTTGKIIVMISKFVYSFGCTIAYTIIIHDNFNPAILHLFHINNNNNANNQSSFSILFQWFYWMIQHDIYCTWFICAIIIFPLCCMRDMSTLASTSFISIIAMISIVSIVIYMWYTKDVTGDNNGHQSDNNNTTFITDYDYYDRIHNNFTDIINEFVTTTYNNNKLYYPVVISPSIYRHWFQIRWMGLLNNMGTFVFSFVCHHTVHLTYQSLQTVPEMQNLTTWKYISTVSLSISCIISLTVAIFCYMTFWEHTVSDIFQLYPNTYLIDMAKLLLCITMLLTFPLPFFTCREILILLCFQNNNNNNNNNRNVATNITRNNNNVYPRQVDGDLFEDLNEPLISDGTTVDEGTNRESIHPSTDENDDVDSSLVENNNNNNNVQPPLPLQQQSLLHSYIRSISTYFTNVWNSALLPNDDRQLKFLYHILITFTLWFIITILALAAPNLGDVLDFIGCCSGTLIAFILPGLIAIKLRGWTIIATITLLVGGIIGTIGTVCSSNKLFIDTF